MTLHSAGVGARLVDGVAEDIMQRVSISRIWECSLLEMIRHARDIPRCLRRPGDFLADGVSVLAARGLVSLNVEQHQPHATRTERLENGGEGNEWDFEPGPESSRLAAPWLPDLTRAYASALSRLPKPPQAVGQDRPPVQVDVAPGAKQRGGLWVDTDDAALFTNGSCGDDDVQSVVHAGTGGQSVRRLYLQSRPTERKPCSGS